MTASSFEIEAVSLAVIALGNETVIGEMVAAEGAAVLLSGANSWLCQQWRCICMM